MNAGAPRRPEAPGTLELELQAVLSYPLWMSGTGPLQVSHCYSYCFSDFNTSPKHLENMLTRFLGLTHCF